MTKKEMNLHQQNRFSIKINKILQDKKDNQQFLKLIAPKYMGVYVVDLKKDIFRDIIGPSYFLKLRREQHNCFSATMKLYNNLYISENNQQNVTQFINYNTIIEKLSKNKNIEQKYRKKDGTLIKISIQPYSQDPKDKDLTIWMFTNENSADAVYGSLGEARWSMECDENGNVLSIWWNEETCHLMGYDYDKEYFQTLPPFTHLHPDDLKHTMTALQNVLNDQSNLLKFDIEHRFLTANGQYKWVRSVGKPIRNEEKKRIKFYGLITDIDDHKKNELKRQKDLIDALAAAKHANNAKTQFLNNMSHDIRTPMNAIIGFTALAAGHIDEPEKIKDYLKKITTSSKHLLSLINDVLDMSRIESGRVKIDEKEVHLPDVFHDLRAILQPDISSRGIDLLFDTLGVINEDVICDRLRLNQILLNLLSNALKYTNPGGTVSVRLIQKPKAPKGYAHYEIRVKDNGIGMSEEFQKHIFEAFAREKTSTISGIQGAGLGMAITKNIIDMMGGTIEVHSKLGKGTEFIVNLQFRLNSNPIVYDKIDELQNIRVLVADDDVNTCYSVSQMLQEIGMRSDWTTTGKEAVVRTQFAIQSGDEYGAFIIDWMMPDMNGIEVVRRIRKVIGDAKPIIILTAYDWSNIEEEAREAGVTAFCAKPIFMSELREVLTKPFRLPVLNKKQEKLNHFEGKKILLVEDNELNREIVTEILQNVGFEIDAVDDGDIAVSKMKYAKRNQYDLILMDIQMQRMDGYVATREIRTLPDSQIANIPIIAMTANAFEEDKKAALEAGMNGHIAKPIDIAHLLEILSNTLKGD